MKIIDVNILLYAVNRNCAEHVPIHQWWQRALSGDESIGLPWLVLSGFLRIATNPSIFPQPLTVDEALCEVEQWLCSDVAMTISEKAEHWQVFRELLNHSGTASNLTTDAHLAALAVTYDATLISCDKDFARFVGLRWMNPINTQS